MESDEDFIDIEVRSADEVARRCIVLASLLQIVAFDQGQPGFAVDDLETTAFDRREWLRGNDLWRDVAHSEATVFERPLDLERSAASFDPLLLGETLATLGWALGACSRLLPLQATSPVEIASQVPEPWDSPWTWIASQQLGNESELVAQRELAELWLWRIETELARREARVQDRHEIDSAISDVRSEAIEAGIFPGSPSLDYLALWDDIAHRDVDELASLQSLSEQRLKTLNWICGFGADWDHVPLDV